MEDKQAMKYCIACQELDTDTDKDDPGMPIIIRLEHPCPCSASTTIVYVPHTSAHRSLVYDRVAGYAIYVHHRYLPYMYLVRFM